jgi:glycerol-3-phosphate acyltransferase PlsY
VPSGRRLDAVPTTYLAGHLTRGIDIRTAGSGKAGTLNTHRSLGRTAGTIVVAADTAKGRAP